MTAITRLLSLRVTLRDPEAAAEVTPEALAAYAERTGWTLATTTGAHRVYHRGAGELQVPITSGWPDYGRAVLREIAELATVEDRSPLAVWAELVGWRDPVRRALADIEVAIAGIAARPAMYGRTSETVLFQALAYLDLRAALLGDLGGFGCRAVYERLVRERWGTTSLHASDHLTAEEVGPFVAALAERCGMTPPCHDVAPGEATGAPDAPEVVPPPAVPDTGQGTLPGIDPGDRRRRSTRHVFGGFEVREYPAGPLAPDATTTQVVRACRHCDCLHRVASAGPRLGAANLYSADGETWSETSPVCIAKRPKE